VVDWRAAVPDMGRPQQVIFDQLGPTAWDVFIAIVWHRSGTPPGGRDPQTGEEYRSGTEEEFKTAYELWKEHGRPRIMVYRCTRHAPLEELDPAQFKLVKDFFTQFEAIRGEHPGLYQTFDTPESFEKLLLDHLMKLLLEYGQAQGVSLEPQFVETLLPRVPDNLPRRASFFGREREMETALRALSPADRTWGVLLDGIGGIGKTALAVEAAHRCKEAGLFDAFIFVTAKLNILDPGGIRKLTPAARTLDDFLNETARVLGRRDIPQLTGDARRRALIEALRESRALLIYDNLETLSKEEQEALADFLRELPQSCKAIITSRRRGGEGALWLRLEKLDWEAARAIIEAEAEKAASLSNKLRSAGEARWPELYDETKGSPLALVHVLGLMRVRASLNFDGALELLRGNRDDNLQKFVFQEARRELTENDQSALRALSFFAPSATFEAWRDVADLSRNALEMSVDRLSALSLVDVLAGGERFGLHPLTRNFVRDELLADADVAYQTGMRFANYWIAYALRYGTRENYSTFNLVEAEWTNLDACVEWLWSMAVADGEKLTDADAAHALDTLVAALGSQGGPLLFVGRWDEFLRLNARAYQALRLMADWKSAGWCAFQASWIHFTDDIDEAAKWAKACSEAWAMSGGPNEKAAAARLNSLMASARGDLEAAEHLIQEAIRIWRELRANHSVAWALNDLGKIEYKRKNYDAAQQYWMEGLAIHEGLGDKEGMAGIYGDLGRHAFATGQLHRAHQWLNKALTVAREIGRQDFVAATLYFLALVHEREGQIDQALPLAQEALVIRERLRHKELRVTRALVERLKK
jgi:tetratricopeptide (TPR) repeat protein